MLTIANKELAMGNLYTSVKARFVFLEKDTVLGILLLSELFHNGTPKGTFHW